MLEGKGTLLKLLAASVALDVQSGYLARWLSGQGGRRNQGRDGFLYWRLKEPTHMLFASMGYA